MVIVFRAWRKSGNFSDHGSHGTRKLKHFVCQAIILICTIQLEMIDGAGCDIGMCFPGFNSTFCLSRENTEIRLANLYATFLEGSPGNIGACKRVSNIRQV
jgi:hypothetical protein